VVVEGAPKETATPPEEELAAEAGELVAGGLRPRDAARAVATRHGASANDVYRALLEARATSR
jgi:hypothetical protein